MAEETKAVEKILMLVVTGEQDEAEKLITENPKLLLIPGKVTDLSERTFENTTAFQYALWALDWHMWKMLSKYLSEDAAAKQFEQLESKGLTYTTLISKGLEGLTKTLAPKELFEDKGSKQTPHIDLLLKALYEYIENAPKWNYDTRAQEHWQKVVGGAQRLLPVHVVNEYCRADRSFDPTPKFLEDVLPRTRKTDVGDWFAGTYIGNLGDKFGFVRGGAVGGVSGMSAPVVVMIEMNFESIVADHGSLLSMSKTRVQQREELALLFIVRELKKVLTFLDTLPIDLIRIICNYFTQKELPETSAQVSTPKRPLGKNATQPLSTQTAPQGSSAYFHPASAKIKNQVADSKDPKAGSALVEEESRA